MGEPKSDDVDTPASTPESDDGFHRTRSFRLAYNSVGRTSALSRAWTQGRLEALGVLVILAPVLVPLANGEGLRWPALWEIPIYAIGLAIGARLLYRYHKYRKASGEEDMRQHRPFLEADVAGKRFRAACICGWRGAVTSRKSAEVEGLDHLTLPGV